MGGELFSISEEKCYNITKLKPYANGDPLETAGLLFNRDDDVRIYEPGGIEA